LCNSKIIWNPRKFNNFCQINLCSARKMTWHICFLSSYKIKHASIKYWEILNANFQLHIFSIEFITQFSSHWFGIKSETFLFHFTFQSFFSNFSASREQSMMMISSRFENIRYYVILFHPHNLQKKTWIIFKRNKVCFSNFQEKFFSIILLKTSR
jgi:hypothetical protein